MSDLDRFELFIYVAQGESITQAATLLKMTKAALSKQIKRLEAELKVDLFSRYKQRLQLTEQGKALLVQCLRLKRELDDARSICQQFTEKPVGTLHIVVFEYFANQLIFPKLREFLQRYNGLELFIDTSERIPDFEREQVDIAVGFALLAPMDIVRRKMMTTNYVLCASPEYLARQGRPTTPKDLNNHYYIGHSGRSEKQTIRFKSDYQFSFKPDLSLNSGASMIACAKQGLGFIQLPHFLLETSLKSGELVEVLKKYQATGENIYYYYPKYRHIQSKVRKFIDFFLPPVESYR